MPAAAVASLTPAMAGSSGTVRGASGGTGGAQSSLLLRLGRLGVDMLDLGALPQLGDDVGLGPADHEGLDLVLHLVVGRNGTIPHVVDPDHVPAELGLHRFRELSLVELEGGLGE